MSYSLGNIPSDAPAWLVAELRKLQEAMNGPVDSIEFRTLYAAPKKLRDGLTVKADGVVWNPGSGAGVYTYYAGAWNKLG